MVTSPIATMTAPAAVTAYPEISQPGDHELGQADPEATEGEGRQPGGHPLCRHPFDDARCVAPAPSRRPS
jgi:hypothetical protein